MSNYAPSVVSYSVYQQGATSDQPDEFSNAMDQNPISLKMESDMLTQDISGIREAQVFFDAYVDIWRDELEFSIGNLKTYLTDDAVENLEVA